MTIVNRENMQRTIEHAINRSCGENDSNTPDFILAQFLMDCFDAFTLCSQSREQWFGKAFKIGGVREVFAQNAPKGADDA